MRSQLFRAGWVILFALPIAFTIEVIVEQDLPAVQPWKWDLVEQSLKVDR